MIVVLNSESNVRESLDMLSGNWKIEKPIYDLHIGKRSDVVDTPIPIEDVIFHIPTLQDDRLFVLWKCLWPDCHNCCKRQGRLPLTSDDLRTISGKLGYNSIPKFIKNETLISSWQETGTVNTVITTISMLSIKRKMDETEKDDGIPVACRFLDDKGYCKIHPDKPGVCWLYPFASWMESSKGQPRVHATFQFTGDCPGFYTSKTLDPMIPILNEYSNRIYEYNMAVLRTNRENLGSVSIVQD